MNNEIIAIKQMVIELIVNINKRIDDIIISCRNEGSVDQERLGNLLEDMQALAEGIAAIGGYFTGIDLMEFTEKLEMLTEALRSSDTALFSDIMEFEIKDLLTYWQDCLTK
jgi:hypothetical protein